MSTGPQSSLTILFEAPFWIGLYERTDSGKYEVCKITFGSEPKDYEVYEFLLKNWHKLKFSPPIRAKVAIERKVNPKRMQREIQSQLQDKGIDVYKRQIRGGFCSPPTARARRAGNWRRTSTPRRDRKKEGGPQRHAPIRK